MYVHCLKHCCQIVILAAANKIRIWGLWVRGKKTSLYLAVQPSTFLVTLFKARGHSAIDKAIACHTSSWGSNQDKTKDFSSPTPLRYTHHIHSLSHTMPVIMWFSVNTRHGEVKRGIIVKSKHRHLWGKMDKRGKKVICSKKLTILSTPQQISLSHKIIRWSSILISSHNLNHFLRCLKISTNLDLRSGVALITYEL